MSDSTTKLDTNSTENSQTSIENSELNSTITNPQNEEIKPKNETNSTSKPNLENSQKTDLETEVETKSNNENSRPKEKSKEKSKMWKIVTLLAGTLVSLVIISLLAMFFLTPSNFRSPRMDHSHFRLQYIFQGQSEDFAMPRYQVDYIKDVCNDALTESPIHFHDNIGQIVHIHWQKVTGGEVLKFYGLNKIGGIDGIMGWKMDDLAKFKLTQIPIHSQSLPQPKGNDKFWVYAGEKGKFEKRNFEDFVKMDLETFFDQKSIIRQNQEEEDKLKTKTSQNENSNSKINSNLSQNFVQNLENKNTNVGVKLTENLEKNLENLVKIGSLKVLAHNGIDHANETEAEIHLAETQRLEIEKKALEDRNNMVFSSQNNFQNQTTNSSQNSQTLQNNSQQNSSTNSNSQISTNSNLTSGQTSSQISPSTKTEIELKKINNLLGNVVIFVQETEPTQEQIKLRFDNLQPLGESVCGG